MMRGCTLPVVLLVVAGFAHAEPGEPIFRSGNIKVTRAEMKVKGVEKPLVYHALVRGNSVFGGGFADAQYRRMPITYFHPRGPVGMALRRLDWFAGGANTFHADARLPASFVAMVAPTCPLHATTALWSEPPVAVIGMNSAAVAGYARPLQYFDFYEPTRELIDIHEARGEKALFHFVADARARGTQVRVAHGSPREQLRRQGPRRFYNLIIMDAFSGENAEKIFLDLFTREGIAQCMEHLTPDGVLCVHTSNRYLDLPAVLATIAEDSELHIRRARDVYLPGQDRRRFDPDLQQAGHFVSEWAMIARSREVLDMLATPPDYENMVKEFYSAEQLRTQPELLRFWARPEPAPHLWTDRGPNLMHGVLRWHPLAETYTNIVRPVTEFIDPHLRRLGVDERTRRDIGRWDTVSFPAGEWLVQRQLKTNPDVRKLWQ